MFIIWPEKITAFEDNSIPVLCNIKDPSKTRNTYWYNKSQTPRNYEAIDKIVEGALEITDTTPVKFEST